MAAKRNGGIVKLSAAITGKVGNVIHAIVSDCNIDPPHQSSCPCPIMLATTSYRQITRICHMALGPGEESMEPLRFYSISCL
jgi:hypothetical protein